MTEAVRHTPWQAITQTKVGRFVKDQPVAAAALAGGPAVLAGHLATKSDTFARFARQGLVPAAALITAGSGAMLVHDAIVNDVGTNNLKATGKIAGGGALILGSAEAVGRSLGIKSLQVVSNSARFIGAHAGTVGMGVVLVANVGVLAAPALWATYDMHKRGLTRGNALAMSAGVGLLSGLALGSSAGLASANLIRAAEAGAGVAVGAALGTTAYAFGRSAAKAWEEGRTGAAVGNAVVAASAATGGVAAFGAGTGIKAVQTAGRYLFKQNPLLGGAIAATAVGVAGYIAWSKSQEK